MYLHASCFRNFETNFQAAWGPGYQPDSRGSELFLFWVQALGFRVHMGLGVQGSSFSDVFFIWFRVGFTIKARTWEHRNNAINSAFALS